MKSVTKALLMLITVAGGVYWLNAIAIGNEINTVMLSAHLNKKTFSLGETVFLNLAVNNKSTKVVKLFETLPEKDFEFEVKDSRGSTVSLTDYGKKVKSFTEVYKNLLITLKKGEIYSRQIEITKLFDISRPGSYSIKVKRTIIDMTGKRYSTLTSGVVTFSITE